MKSKILADLKELNEINLDEEYKKVYSGADYCPFNKVIDNLLKSAPNNTIKQDVAVKLAVIDSFYAAGVIRYHKSSFFDLVDIIVGIKDFDKRIKSGDLSLVEEIVSKNKYNCISIASKYCTLHNRYCFSKDDFAIYDSSMEKLLPVYFAKYGYKRKTPSYYKNHNDYKGYVACIEGFLDKMGITCKDRKMKFDLFIWGQRGLLK